MTAWRAAAAAILVLILVQPFNACGIEKRKRMPVPDPSACKSAEKAIKELYKDEYSARDTANRRVFAKKLLKQSGDAGNDPPTRWVLLQEAREIAVEAGDRDAAFAAADTTAHIFDIDPIELKSEVLRKATKTLNASEMAESWLDLADQATKSEQLTLAANAASQGLASANRARNPQLVSKAKAASRHLDSIRQVVSPVGAAKQKLAITPEDPEANLAIGRYLCFIRDDWPAGLPCLARSSDPALKALASRDLQLPASAEDQFAVADAWWNSTAKPPAEIDSAAARQRAAYWYRRALPTLSGLHRAMAEKHIAEAAIAAATEPDGAINLLGLIDPESNRMRGNWTLSPHGLSCTEDGSAIRIPYSPPSEYDVLIELTRDTGNDTVGVSLHLEKGWAEAELGGQGNTNNGITDASSTWKLRAGKNQGIQNATVYRMLMKVRHGRLTVYVDDQLLAELATDGSGLSVDPTPMIEDLPVLGLSTASATMTVNRLELREVTGHGRIAMTPPAAPTN